MKKKIILILVLVLLFLVLLTNGLQGEEENIITCFRNGNDYLKLAEENKYNYVVGLMDMLYRQTYYYDTKLYSDLNKATKDMTAGQIQAIFDKYLEEYPEEWHMTASGLLYNAIMEIVNKK